MTKFKIDISMDQKNFFWIVADNMFIPTKLIWNPTKEDLKDTVISNYYNRTNICPRCREENNIAGNSILYPGNVSHETDKKGNKTEVWVCKRHGLISYKRYDPNSLENIKKSLSDRRTGKLKYHNHILGDNCEELTKKWLGVKRLSVENDKYSRLSSDHSPIPEGFYITIGEKLVDLSGKIPSTKGRLYNPKYKRWPFTCIDEEFDILICYCISDDGKYIERIYIFNKKEIRNITMIKIHKGPSKYETCRVKEEKELYKVNYIWQKIINKSK